VIGGGLRVKDAIKARVGPVIASRRRRRVDLPAERWGLSVGSNGTMWSGDVDLAALARVHGTPVHVVRGDRLDRNIDAARVDGAQVDAAPVDVFYSYKTNPVPAVLRRLHARGVGAEVISPFELWLALRLGVPGERIIYNGPAKSEASVRTAICHGVLLNANSAGDAERITSLAAELRRTVRLGVRINLPGMWGGQFGISAASPQAVDTVRRALDAPLVELLALHFHRGGTIRDVDAMQDHLGAVLGFCDHLRARTGWHPALLDVGGSLACPTVATIPSRELRFNRALGTDLLAPDPADTIGLAQALPLAAQTVADHFAKQGLPAPAVVVEPGRALTADTQFLLTTVLDVKDDGGLAHAVLDAGINIAEPVTSEYHQLFSVSAPNAPATTPYRLVGPICTPADVLYNNWRLPPLEPGHVLAIMDSGAYFVPFSTSFSFPRPAVLVQDGAKVVSGRRRESFEDLVAADRFDDADDLLSHDNPG
jgi:diaminopimelate decarboxylase